jgi:hypothetical protein
MVSIAEFGLSRGSKLKITQFLGLTSTLPETVEFRSPLSILPLNAHSIIIPIAVQRGESPSKVR